MLQRSVLARALSQGEKHSAAREQDDNKDHGSDQFAKGIILLIRRARGVSWVGHDSQGALNWNCAASMRGR
jgi:hypothetical protein